MDRIEARRSALKCILVGQYIRIPYMYSVSFFLSGSREFIDYPPRVVVVVHGSGTNTDVMALIVVVTRRRYVSYNVMISIAHSVKGDKPCTKVATLYTHSYIDRVNSFFQCTPQT